MSSELNQFTTERARSQKITAEEFIGKKFADRGILSKRTDAVFYSADRTSALAFTGLLYYAPICAHLLNDERVEAWLTKNTDNKVLSLSEGKVKCFTEKGEENVPAVTEKAIVEIYERLFASKGKLNKNGELSIDLMGYPVGSHYPVNLLLGNRAGYPYPLYTTPKSALDALGRGSFRGTGGNQVLATRYVLELSENGEPANRQFYIVENGKQIFYSAYLKENVESAECVHSQSRTIITYKTKCGLMIRRTIFILPQEEGLPNAIETQRVEITNLTDKKRDLKIVMTGMFGITDPSTIANDIVYANIVAESEMFYKDGRPAVMTLHHRPKQCACEKRFAFLMENGEFLDSFCASYPDFVGNGDLIHPELVKQLPNTFNRKMAPFFAMGKKVTVEPQKTANIYEFVGMMDDHDKEDITGDFEHALGLLIDRYSDEKHWNETYESVVDFWNRYPGYLTPRTGDEMFDAYTGHNLPFQTLYQTYVSRAFAWTQKSYRETGFREIQDIYASMYYLSAIGENKLVKELLSNWVMNVFRMGYAYHNFTFRGKEPGDCSDDQLWLVQAVDRYIRLTGDYEFLNDEFKIAGEDKTRPLWDTLMAILTYSGRISIGKNFMPLLDKADWNDTLRLDKNVLQGPEKEALYKKQLKDKNEEYGVPWENDLTESVMNACLLIIAADAIRNMAIHVGKTEDAREAEFIANRVRESMQKNAWKGDFFARCLINDDRKYKYLGAGKDGLSMVPEIDGTYFLNSYSWAILADAATEEQIATMLGIVERYLKTNAGLKLCTLVDFDKLDIFCGTQLYFPGDRENGGVFKHAAMMAATASLKAAKWVKDVHLAEKLRDLAFFMIGKTLPYVTQGDPFVLKGNPRFCTQYNNSETGENIGPMLSGTASWLTLALFEFSGVDVHDKRVTISPVLKRDTEDYEYTLNFEHGSIDVKVTGKRAFRVNDDSVFNYDGVKCTDTVDVPTDGKTHTLTITL